MVKSDFHDPLDAESVDVSHGEVLDAELLHDEAVFKKKKQFTVFACWNMKFTAAARSTSCDSDNSLLPGVDIPQSNVHQVPGGQDWLHPGEPWDIWHLWRKDRVNVWLGEPSQCIYIQENTSAFCATPENLHEGCC